MTLHEWGIFHGSDKAYAHNYLNFYEAKIGMPHSILEFGVLNGASLKMWRDKYNAFVIGLDIEKKQPITGITVLQMDATDEKTATYLSNLYNNFDLIVDDASHMVADQIKSFQLFWPFVNKGGCYIIEDCHTMHYDQYNPSKIDFKAWVESLGIEHEYFLRVPGDESDSMTLIFWK